MKQWNPWNWIAYVFIGTTVFLTAIGTASKENIALSNWLSPFLKTYVLGYGPAILFLIATIIFIIQKIKGGKAEEIGKVAKVLPPPTLVLSPTPGLPKPKKFYTQRNKSDLADALTDLSVIFNTTGANIEQKTHQIVNKWNIEVIGKTRQRKMPNTADLIGQLSELSNLTVILNRTLYDDNGFVKKNRTYSDELNPILQFPQKGPLSADSPISILQISINVFRNGISPIELAKKYNDQELISSMAENLELAFRNYLKGCDAFRQWRDDTQKRIDTFRNSLL